MAKFATLACLAFSGREVVRAMADECVDANVAGSNEPSCLTNVKWAMTEGFLHNPEWYTKYGITSKSDFTDFQCALWSMKGSGSQNGESHGCKRPCSSHLAGCAGLPKAKEGVTTEVESSLSPAGICGVILAVVVIGIAAGYFLMPTKDKKKPNKKKRSVSVEPKPDPSPEPEYAPVPEVTTSPYTYVTTSAPVYMQNEITTAAPIYMSAPSAPSYVPAMAMPQSSSFLYSAPTSSPYAMPLQTTSTGFASYYTSTEQ